MSTIRDLLTRLDNIGRDLAQSDHALALLGLGSVGLELDRLDAYSDLPSIRPLLMPFAG